MIDTTKKYKTLNGYWVEFISSNGSMDFPYVGKIVGLVGGCNVRTWSRKGVCSSGCIEFDLKEIVPIDIINLQMGNLIRNASGVFIINHVAGNSHLIVVSYSGNKLTISRSDVVKYEYSSDRGETWRSCCLN